MKAQLRFCSDCGAWRPDHDDDEGRGTCHRHAPAPGTAGWPPVEEVDQCADSIPMTPRQKAFAAAHIAANDWADTILIAEREAPELHDAIRDADKVFALGDRLVVRMSDEALAIATQPLHRAWLDVAVGPEVDLRLEHARAARRSHTQHSEAG